ncbi:MAG TPA: hypothetical protein VI229_00260 [Burkholderiales bacterium]
MPNPKSPTPAWWTEVLRLLDERRRVTVCQLGLEGEPQLVEDFRRGLPMVAIAGLIARAQVWVSCDSFLPHLARHVGAPGVVVWSRSDPRIFGYAENDNLLADRKYLRAEPFAAWETESYVASAFPEQEAVVNAICRRLVARERDGDRRARKA